MSDVIALNANQHRHAGWKPVRSYGFARQQTLAPITAEEVGHVLPTMPMGFARVSGSDSESRWIQVAVLSDGADQNLYLHPNGRWLAGYVPACFRAYPFKLVTDSTGQMAVGFDRDSGLWSEQSDTETQPFFNEAGELTEKTRKVADFLTQYEKNRILTERAVLSLVDAGVMVPWKVQRSGESEPKVLIPGLHRIDEQSLQSLSGDTLASLASSGALSLAYAQMLSQQRLTAFAKLKQLHDEIDRQQRPVDVDDVDLDALFGEDDDTFKFD